MNAEIKKLWVDALRSGDYKQGVGALHRPVEDTYCCLGVLCDLAVKAKVIEQPVAQQRGEAVLDYYCGASWGSLPDIVMFWAGLQNKSGDPVKTKSRAVLFSLAKLNDCGVKFDEIADAIEEQL